MLVQKQLLRSNCGNFRILLCNPIHNILQALPCGEFASKSGVLEDMKDIFLESEV